MIARDGFDVVSVRTVAAECDISAGTVQSYYPTRQALLTAALNRSFERQQIAIRTEFDGVLTFSGLTSILLRLLPTENALREDAVAWVSFVAAAGTRPWLAEIVTEGLQSLQAFITKQLSVPNTGLRLVAGYSPEQAARLITALLDGLTLDVIAVPANAQYARDDLERGLELFLQRD